MSELIPSYLSGDKSGDLSDQIRQQRERNRPSKEQLEESRRLARQGFEAILKQRENNKLSKEQIHLDRQEFETMSKQHNEAKEGELPNNGS
jgi:hypothetical protein